MKKVSLTMFTLALFTFSIVGCYTPNGNSGENGETTITNRYYVPLKSDGYRKAQLMQLKTVKSWQGSEKKEIKYNAQKSPWVLNAGHKVTSKLESQFGVGIVKEASSGLRVSVGHGGSFGDIESYIVEGAGEYILLIGASGCEWWVKVGCE